MSILLKTIAGVNVNIKTALSGGFNEIHFFAYLAATGTTSFSIIA